MEILVQLNDELGRLYIAGSKNAINDPRIKKYIPTFEKLAEKSKAFLALKNALEVLVNGDEEDSYNILAKTYTLVNSILVTQTDISCNNEELVELEKNEKVFRNVLTYKELNTFINDYANSQSEKDKERILEAINNDIRCYDIIDSFLGNSYRNVNMYEALLKLDDTLALYILNNFEIKNTLACGEKLDYIKKMLKDDSETFKNKVIPLAKKIIEEKCTKVIPNALETLGFSIENEDIVLSFSNKKKQEYLESSLIALYTMGSKEFQKVFEQTGKNNLNTCVDSLIRISSKNDELITSLRDYVFNQYMERLYKREKEVEYRDSLTNKIALLFSKLDYDKYHSFYDNLFKISWIFSDDFYSESYDLVMFNLISNDIRYNTLIFESISDFLELNKKKREQKKREKLYLGKNKIYYYYLIVVKNLFDEKKATKLSIEFLDFCKDINVLTANFKNNKYYDLTRIVKYLSKNIDVEKIESIDLKNKYENFKADVDIRNINGKVFDFLFYDTYYFQSIFGDGFNRLKNFDRFLLENAKLKADFLKKIVKFVKTNLSNNKAVKINIGLERYYLESLIFVDDVEFAKTYFDLSLYLLEGVDDIEKYKIRRRKTNNYIYDNETIEYNSKIYKKYEYLLEDKKYEKLKEIFN